MRKVFVPGGLPEYTYVSRDDLNLEGRIQAASDNLCKLITVTGPTKSGKSVLTQRVFPKDSAVWIEGGSITAESDLWDQVVAQLEGFTKISHSTSAKTTAGASAEIKGQLGMPSILGFTGGVSPKIEQTRDHAETQSREVPSKAKALDLLRTSGRPIIIDDFHYLERDAQGSVVRALKALVFVGHPALLLAIPHRRYDAVRVESEMTGRVQQVPIPSWSKEELRRIASVGFPLLNVDLDDGLVELFVAESLGSPHLMQEFCRQLCEENQVAETARMPMTLRPKQSAQKLFETVATDTSKTVFERLAKGPRPRKDRIQRQFKDGRSADLYVAVLLALARLKPGTSTYEYEDIRATLRELLVDLPQAADVSRVLEHMSKIQASDTSSAPVLDWEKKERRLHITDPFFAFFLKWGGDLYEKFAKATPID